MQRLLKTAERPSADLRLTLTRGVGNALRRFRRNKRRLAEKNVRPIEYQETFPEWKRTATFADIFRTSGAAYPIQTVSTHVP